VWEEEKEERKCGRGRSKRESVARGGGIRRETVWKEEEEEERESMVGEEGRDKLQ